MGMPLDSGILQKVVDFLKDHVDPLWYSEPQLHVPAATAIMC